MTPRQNNLTNEASLPLDNSTSACQTVKQSVCSQIIKMVIRVKKERQFDLRTYDIVDTHKNI